ncbi:radical SAM protein [bacterium]|nr:radical SAM protein [bacterium]
MSSKNRLIMVITEIEAKSILRKHKKIDSWFVSRYGMNLYRGCIHDCVYCDGRAERYNVDGDFGKDIAVKVNAIELLERELDPRRKRIPLIKGFIILGGGVGDSYQPAEKRYQLTRKALELLLDYDFPVHILTKSTLVERDIDLLTEINKKSKVLVSISFSSTDEEISRRFEPRVPSPRERLNLLKEIKKQGIACGMFLMPVIPHITDTPHLLDQSLARAAEAKLDYVIFSGMTLKPGRQQDHFFAVLRESYPELLEEYHSIYANAGKWGNASYEYYDQLHLLFDKIAGQYKIPRRIPLGHFKDHINENDRVVIILEQMDYILKMRGQKSPYGYGAYSISQLKQPIGELTNSLRQLKGVGPVTERIVREILQTGSSTYYEKLMS